MHRVEYTRTSPLQAPFDLPRPWQDSWAAVAEIPTAMAICSSARLALHYSLRWSYGFACELSLFLLVLGYFGALHYPFVVVGWRSWHPNVALGSSFCFRGLGWTFLVAYWGLSTLPSSHRV